ncbi:SAF domain-containing protein [Microbacterium sp.]|uniref:SAF domain-containing protein n=1 Tax=Microbacterium sp. TaxID=51671 RepID=UPI0028A82F78|nr:SAF domain-containing protein [Microbacterium sp.]
MIRSRAHRPFFGDLRFLIGVALVLASIAGVWLLVSTSRQTAPVLQATRTVLPGEAISSAELQVVEVGLGTLSGSYLAPQSLQPGAVAVRTLTAGELVPLAAVGDPDALRTTSVVIRSTAVPADVSAGTVVELWHAPPIDDGRAFEEPRILVADAVIARVAEEDGMLAGGRIDVEVVVDRADVADVLAAITGGDAISIVPTGAGS